MFCKIIFEIPVRLNQAKNETEKVRYFFFFIAKIKFDIQKAFTEKTSFPSQYSGELNLLRESYLTLLNEFKDNVDFRRGMFDRLMKMPVEKAQALEYFSSQTFTDEERKKLIALYVRFYLYGKVAVYQDEATYLCSLHILAEQLNRCLG